MKSESRETHQGRFLLTLFCIAFLIRLGAVLALRDISAPPSSRVTGADGVEYNLLGLRVSRGEGYTLESGHPTSFRAPGLPLFLAASYSVFGERYPVIYVLYCLLGAATCAATYAIARDLLDERAARWAGWLACFYLPHIYFATRFDSENLFSACLACGIFLVLHHLRTRSTWSALIAGALLGYAALTRAFAVMLLPLVASLVTQIRSQAFPIKRRLMGAVVLAMAFLAVIVPWTARNYNVHGQFVLIATNGGSTFYGGNNSIVLEDPRHYGGWVATTVLPGRDVIEATPTEVSHDRVEWQLGKDWVRNNLVRVPLLELYKFVRFSLPDIDSANKTYVWIQILGSSPWLLLTSVGVAGSLRRPRLFDANWMTLHVVLLASLITALVFWGSPRFRDANTPILMIYAALGLCWFRKLWFRSSG